MSEIAVQSPVKLTEKAISELMNIKQKEEIPLNYKLRIGVKSGGCSGYSYILGFDGKTETDGVYFHGNVEIIIDKSHLVHLVGIEIDFKDGLNNRGFIFNNPNATETCGCGTSFAT